MVDERESIDAGAEGKPADGTADTSQEASMEALKKELATEKEKAERYLANWQRSQADFINYKRRTEQQREEDSKFAGAGIVFYILPVLDDLERAMRTIPPSLVRFTWFEGVALIYHKLRATLEANGVTEIQTANQSFDPALHEAVIHGEGEEGKVVAEYQKGYKLHDRVIRPAMVAVGIGTKPSQGEPAGQEK